MAPSQPAFPRRSNKSASPAERSDEFAEIQRRLKQEAAERRLQNAARPRPVRAKPRARG